MRGLFPNYLMAKMLSYKAEEFIFILLLVTELEYLFVRRGYEQTVRLQHSSKRCFSVLLGRLFPMCSSILIQEGDTWALLV